MIAEDDAIIAFDTLGILREAGAEVVGCGSTLKETLSLVQTPLLSAALLDVNLGNEKIYPAALALEERGVGVVFYTSSARADGIVAIWAGAQVLSKPAPPRLLVEAVVRACAATELAASNSSVAVDGHVGAVKETADGAVTPCRH